MAMTLKEFTHTKTRTDFPEVKPGHVVKVYQKIMETKISNKKEEAKERIQVFEGLVISRRGGKGISANITVRKISGGIGVERIFPINAPTIEKIELVKTTKTRRAKLYYMRDRIGKATRPKGEMVKEEKTEKEAVDKEPRAEKAVPEAEAEIEQEKKNNISEEKTA